MHLGLALLAGLLSTLSPCVLPILPILLGSALEADRRAPVALAGGLAIAYAAVGTAVASLGRTASLNSEVFRQTGAILLALFALVILSNGLQRWFATTTSGVTNAGNRLLSRLRLGGMTGQFVVGLVLGMIWSPCVGPTLGAAIVLASQGKQLISTAIVMGLFSLGAALPIVVIGSLSRSAMMKAKRQLVGVASAGKFVLGIAMLLIAVASLSGGDRRAEAWLVTHSPIWLTRFTTQF